jgi:methionine sulfoxide reductase heme-binding subunit
MKSKSGAMPWMGLAFCSAAILAAAVLAQMGTGAEARATALRVTERLSFLFFWLSYAGGAIAKLFGPAFAALAKHGRDLGLSFAAAHFVHVALIAWGAYLAEEPLRFTGWFVRAECVGLAWVYALALLPIDRLRAMLNPKFLRFFFAAGLEYIAFIFFVNLLYKPLRMQPPDLTQILPYLPFAVLVVLGPLLRWLAMARSWRQREVAPMKADISG